MYKAVLTFLFILAFSNSASAAECTGTAYLDSAPIIDMETIFVEGWQTADGNGHESCREYTTPDVIKCGLDTATPSHEWWVHAFVSAYTQAQWKYLATMFRTLTKKDSERAMVNPLNPCYKYIPLAVAHVMSCYPPSPHAQRIGNGAIPTWHEPKDAGLASCQG
jgi:hypothetical protein